MPEWQEGAGLKIGDIVTFARHPPWWERLAIWLGVYTPPPLKQFVVTASSEEP